MGTRKALYSKQRSLKQPLRTDSGSLTEVSVLRFNYRASFNCVCLSGLRCSLWNFDGRASTESDFIIISAKNIPTRPSKPRLPTNNWGNRNAGSSCVRLYLSDSELFASSAAHHDLIRSYSPFRLRTPHVTRYVRFSDRCHLPPRWISSRRCPAVLEISLINRHLLLSSPFSVNLCTKIRWRCEYFLTFRPAERIIETNVSFDRAYIFFKIVTSQRGIVDRFL